jgi:hypothetical protein
MEHIFLLFINIAMASMGHGVFFFYYLQIMLWHQWAMCMFFILFLIKVEPIKAEIKIIKTK